jgi:hypothetical protein
MTKPADPSLFVHSIMRAYRPDETVQAVAILW